MAVWPKDLHSSPIRQACKILASPPLPVHLKMIRIALSQPPERALTARRSDRSAADHLVHGCLNP
jgi:hypothetical protein